MCKKRKETYKHNYLGERTVGGRLERVKGLFLLGVVMGVENGGCTVRGGEWNAKTMREVVLQATEHFKVQRIV